MNTFAKRRYEKNLCSRRVQATLKVMTQNDNCFYATINFAQDQQMTVRFVPFQPLLAAVMLLAVLSDAVLMFTVAVIFAVFLG